MEKTNALPEKISGALNTEKQGELHLLRREAVLNNGFLSEKQQMTKKRYLYGKIISCRIYHFIYN